MEYPKAKEALDERLRAYMKQRTLSKQITFQDHVPKLEDLDRTFQRHPSIRPECILLGDAQLLPIEIIQPYGEPALNLSISDERIEHLLYRLQLGVLDLLRKLGPKVIVLHIGAHNIWDSATEPLDIDDIERYKLLLHSLLQCSASTKVFVTALFPRRHFHRTVIGKANEIIRKLADEININEKSQRVRFIKSPDELTEQYLNKSMLLNDKGLEIWNASLQTQVTQLFMSRKMQSSEIPDGSQRRSSPGRARSCRAQKLRPAHDVMARILHDRDHFDPDDIIIGYEDRFEGTMEMPFNTWEWNSDEENWLPMHRIRYFRWNREDGVDKPRNVLWDREKRIDKVFRTDR